MKIAIDVPDEWIELLAILGGSSAEQLGEDLAADIEDAAAAIRILADHARQGVYRPGSWERSLVVRVFGSGFVDQLEQDPSTTWRMRPRRSR